MILHGSYNTKFYERLNQVLDDKEPVYIKVVSQVSYLQTNVRVIVVSNNQGFSDPNINWKNWQLINME